MSDHLHIVSFDVPFPANYGGVIDVFYKLKTLNEQGIKIILHCFAYGRSPSAELEKLCAKVYYYERRTGPGSMLSLLPYNVKSRQSADLETNLLADNYPILFEVLHTCYLLDDPRFKNRKKIYRHSNIEHDYYSELSKSERNWFKKIYLKTEAWKLKRFEKILHRADVIFAVNQKDTDYFRKKFPGVRSEYLPSFHPNKAVVSAEGKGSFILFHGNLSVSENYEAAEWLIKNVFSNVSVSCKIAGLNPPLFLKELVGNFSNVELVANPDEDEMDRLVKNAQAHILYTAQPTGLKLKLLNVLFNGRFIICNNNMISGTGLNENKSFLIVDQPEDFIQKIREIMDYNFSQELIHQREQMVSNFDNLKNGKRLVEVAFQGLLP